MSAQRRGGQALGIGEEVWGSIGDLEGVGGGLRMTLEDSKGLSIHSISSSIKQLAIRVSGKSSPPLGVRPSIPPFIN